MILTISPSKAENEKINSKSQDQRALQIVLIILKIHQNFLENILKPK